MLLVIDIGNTNITLGIYEKDNLLGIHRIETNVCYSRKDYELILKEQLAKYKISKIFVGSVVEELNDIIPEACKNVFGIEALMFSSHLNTGVKLDISNPESVGSDRIANAYYALKNYHVPCIVVDLGSATTFDIISADGKFIGGIIMPGINMQLEALHEKTSKLPKIKIQDVENVVGIDTQSAILSGVIRGHACAIEGLIEHCEKELNQKVTIIATGGLANCVAKYMNRKFLKINPTLTLDGFKELYYLNI